MKKSNNAQSQTEFVHRIPRRDLFAALGATALIGVRTEPAVAAPATPLKISVFSKHFQWTNCREMAAIAKEVGFDGIDLTVREGGHVLPERVEADLPKEPTRSVKLGLS